MIERIKKTIQTVTAGIRGMFDGISRTWTRSMSYYMCRFWPYDESKKLFGGKDALAWKLAAAGSMAGDIAGFVGNPGEIVMVQLRGDFAKLPEINYKHCFDALFRMSYLFFFEFVSYSSQSVFASVLSLNLYWLMSSSSHSSGPWGSALELITHSPSSFMRLTQGISSLACSVGPNMFRAVLMNAGQLASYDFSKAELIKTHIFEDNIPCHFTANFVAGTVATTVCSPADVLKSRIMNLFLIFIFFVLSSLFSLPPPSAEKLFQANLSLTSRNGSVLKLRDAAISLTLIKAFQTSLGRPGNGSSVVTATLLDVETTLAELTSLEEMMHIMSEEEQIHQDVISRLWQIYSMSTWHWGSLPLHSVVQVLNKTF
ncbi:uncharacterized protein LACBIDRAFT_307876 [Laccaria bicolor S238N-H82]|uniref:Predicted protein n=1 Tax=Laccaria bicolor (strain S238N-H82 / ATCC MYA-4686) TaxID=486041 RepID=B0DQW8_LACBS|nr:uncharacterized protein LACBIDRAFT_307876 [Laccaria bicolor S238N-H82]EDR03015.1 predicted protein [Laccaria bicolor S238N-H82]|eukprot:XP_001886438.1 predicted protein [Laccaria bicolor S238N-H82]